jgi:hypothetical protein
MPPPAPPPSRAVGSAPQSTFAGASLGSNAPGEAARPATARPSPIDDPSLSMPIVARRPLGLIAVVLLVDIGLAVAGGWMLSRGLGTTPTIESK